MTTAQLHDLLRGMPYPLTQQITGYVLAVQDKLAEIFQEAGVQRTETLERSVLMVATMRKLTGIVATAFWTADNCLEDLGKNGCLSFRIGATTYERQSADMIRLRALRDELVTFMVQQNMMSLIAMPYQDVVRALANG